MLFPRLLLKNAFRHRLRTTLTIAGLAVVIMAYGLINTIIEAWYTNVEATSSTRLITRSSISIAYPLPASLASRIRHTEGVQSLTWLSWFGGTYGNRQAPFPKFAVDAHTYFDLFPEYMVSRAQLRDFQQDRLGVIIGPKLASNFGWKVGDTIPIEGDVYPGQWRFTVRGIYQARDSKTEDTLMVLHWDLLSATINSRVSGLGEHVGIYVVGIDNPDQASVVSRRIDALFHNSAHETLTETEKAYQLGIVALSRTILLAIRLVSFVLILIIMAVMANTMIMSATERRAEYATLRALGFSPSFVVKLLFGESMLIALLGGSLGIALTYPATAVLVSAVGSLFKTFYVSPATMLTQVGAAVFVGMMAAAWPSRKMSALQIAPSLQKAT